MRLTNKSSKPALPVRNIVEPVPASGGELNWYFTSKTPVAANDGKVIGIAIAMRDFERVGAMAYREL